MPHANTHVCMCNTLRLATHATYVRLPYIIANNNVLIRYSTPLAVHGADASLSRSSSRLCQPPAPSANPCCARLTLRLRARAARYTLTLPDSCCAAQAAGSSCEPKLQAVCMAHGCTAHARACAPARLTAAHGSCSRLHGSQLHGSCSRLHACTPQGCSRLVLTAARLTAAHGCTAHGPRLHTARGSRLHAARDFTRPTAHGSRLAAAAYSRLRCSHGCTDHGSMARAARPVLHAARLTLHAARPSCAAHADHHTLPPTRALARLTLPHPRPPRAASLVIVQASLCMPHERAYVRLAAHTCALHTRCA